MEKKVTQREMFEKAKEVCVAHPDLVEFFDSRIALLDNKKSQGKAKDTAKQTAEEEVVYTALVGVGRPITVSELIAECGLDELANEKGIVSPQKVAPVLKRLVEQGRVSKETDKKSTLFKVADTE
jgi:hypothetical protein